MTFPDDPKELSRLTREAVVRAGNRPPLELFADLVARGLIDAEGHVLAPEPGPARQRRRAPAVRKARRT